MIWIGYKTVSWAEKEISAYSNVFLRFIILYFNNVFLNFTMIITFLTIIMLLMSISLGLNATKLKYTNNDKIMTKYDNNLEK